MSFTRGGENKRKHFKWHFITNPEAVVIQKNNGKELIYSLQEVSSILNAIHSHFQTKYFPLANNVEKLGNGTEQMGLGPIILKQKRGDITRAQGASYLGVVLEECHYLSWNGKHREIEWRLVTTDFSSASIIAQLKKAKKLDIINKE